MLAGSNVIAFDGAAATHLHFATIIGGTSAEHQRAIVWHIVEEVVVMGRKVASIRARPEARPFFAEFHCRCCDGAP